MIFLCVTSSTKGLQHKCFRFKLQLFVYLWRESWVNNRKRQKVLHFTYLLLLSHGYDSKFMAWKYHYMSIIIKIRYEHVLKYIPIHYKSICKLVLWKQTHDITRTIQSSKLSKCQNILFGKSMTKISITESWIIIFRFYSHGDGIVRYYKHIIYVRKNQIFGIR